MLKGEIAYSEVYDILKLMDREDVLKIPMNVLEKIDEKRDKNYNSNINIQIPLDSQGVSRKALAVLAWINLEYWCEGKEREFLIKFYKNNDKKTNRESNCEGLVKQNLSGELLHDLEIKKIELPMVRHEENLWQRVVKKLKEFWKFN